MSLIKKGFFGTSIQKAFLVISENTDEKIDVEENNEIGGTKSTRLLLYLIAGLSSSATFIGRIFIGLYAAFIDSSALAISFIVSLRNLTMQIFQFTFGRISDRVGRKIVMLIGIIVAGVSIALFPLIKNGWVLVGGVVGFSIGFSMYYPSFTAIQGDITNKKNRAGLISLITIIGAFATLIGLIVVGFAGEIGSTEAMQYTIILELTAGIFLLAAIVSVFLHDPPREKLKEKTPFSFDPLRANPNFRRFVIINSIMSFTMAIGWPIFPIVREEYATTIQNTWIWAVFAACQIIILASTYKLINRIGRKPLLLIGRIAMFIVPLILAISIRWFPDWRIYFISGSISGACNAFYMVGQNSFILDSASEKEKGTYTGVYNFFIGISTFLGSLIMGFIADFYIARYEKWTVIFVLTLVITGVRFLGGFGFFFLKEPVQTQIVKKLADDTSTQTS